MEPFRIQQNPPLYDGKRRNDIIHKLCDDKIINGSGIKRGGIHSIYHTRNVLDVRRYILEAYFPIYITSPNQESTGNRLDEPLITLNNDYTRAYFIELASSSMFKKYSIETFGSDKQHERIVIEHPRPIEAYQIVWETVQCFDDQKGFWVRRDYDIMLPSPKLEPEWEYSRYVYPAAPKSDFSAIQEAIDIAWNT